MKRAPVIAMLLLAAMEPVGADERFYVVGSAFQTRHDGDDVNALITHTARVYLGDRQTDALILCSGSLAYGRNENILDSQLGCTVVRRQGGPVVAGAYAHHALALDNPESSRPLLDAFITVAHGTNTARFCIVLSTLDLACVEAHIPVPQVEQPSGPTR